MGYRHPHLQYFETQKDAKILCSQSERKVVSSVPISMWNEIQYLEFYFSMFQRLIHTKSVIIY